MKIKIISAIALSLGASMAIAGTDTPISAWQQIAPEGVMRVSSQCAGGLSYCGPGPLGNGGCYNAGNSYCRDGYICPSGMSICTNDAQGGRVPYCYNKALPNTCRN